MFIFKDAKKYTKGKNSFTIKSCIMCECIAKVDFRQLDGSLGI